MSLEGDILTKGHKHKHKKKDRHHKRDERKAEEKRNHERERQKDIEWCKDRVSQIFRVLEMASDAFDKIASRIITSEFLRCMDSKGQQCCRDGKGAYGCVHLIWLNIWDKLDRYAYFSSEYIAPDSLENHFKHLKENKRYRKSDRRQIIHPLHTNPSILVTPPYRLF